MKLSVNEAKLTGLWARNCATIQQALISKFAFRARKVIGTFETRAPQTRKYKRKPEQKPRIGSSERQI